MEFSNAYNAHKPQGGSTKPNWQQDFGTYLYLYMYTVSMKMCIIKVLFQFGHYMGFVSWFPLVRDMFTLDIISQFDTTVRMNDPSRHRRGWKNRYIPSSFHFTWFSRTWRESCPTGEPRIMFTLSQHNAAQRFVPLEVKLIFCKHFLLFIGYKW